MPLHILKILKRNNNYFANFVEERHIIKKGFVNIVEKQRSLKMIREFSTVMKSKRKELKISINQLSQITNISKSMLYDYENGIREPTTKRFLKICGVLKINPRNFLKN